MLATAGRLFYEHGIGTTGVEAVASAAGVGKPAIYRHFGSKAGLIDEVLAKRDDDRRQSLVEALAQAPSCPIARLKAAVDWQLEWVASAHFCGCSFVRAAAERQAGGTAAAEHAYAHKTWYRHELEQLAREAGASDPAKLGMRLALVIEGATTLAFLGDRTEIIEAGRQQTRELIEAACRC